ncbi:MAG: threonine--tRNA ligase [Gammaproteobacteria bacterium GWE2_42_36]|nr:MAG: threonine--tRNA ligase [Gammaproteobacteria bacterium GWE2_42_36]HCU05179.1 threonine--tRNA ligase [Coxiellaceae bacterium]
MPIITLPDNSQKSFDSTVSVYDIAKSIGDRLAAAAIAAKVDGQLVDVSFRIDKDAQVTILTDKNPEALAIIRHSTAHLLAHAVKQLFPEAKIAIGPVIEEGFYYDFDLPHHFTPDDLTAIEARMKALAQQNIPMIRKDMSRAAALSFFEQQQEIYKTALIRDLPENEPLSIYEQGEFTDLCRGPHAASTGQLKAFKLIKLAGAYWRGDSKNKMLQRIYGTAFFNQKDLDAYLQKLIEAEKRDHRKLGKHMDLFHFDMRSPGMIFWHDKGWKIYQSIVQYMREKLRDYDYQEVNTPIILARGLWEQSGHWEKYQDNMFITQSEDQLFAIKPMNCPGNIQVFNQGLKSYRDLPLRMAEFGQCHRNELSGALHGLMRIRQFTQDDAHIFCTEQQMLDEIATLIHLTFEVYKTFGFEKVTIRLATRPSKRIGADENWDRAEQALADALNQQKLAFTLAPGEGAFYGPKIEFHLHDCLDRTWQCGTIQVDFSMPVRLGVEYVAEDGERKTPVMIHRTIIGSIERFIGILLEQYAGKLPLWLAPVQVVVMNITDEQADYAESIVKIFKKQGIRAISDLRNEKIGFKIREHTLQNIPYLLVVGDRERASGLVSVRTQSGRDLGNQSIEDFLNCIHSEIVQYERVM